MSVVRDLPDIILSEFPNRAADLLAFVEKGSSPVSSFIADVGAKVDVVFLDPKLCLPVSVLDRPFGFTGLAMGCLHHDTVLS